MDSRSQGDLSGSTDRSHRLSAHSLPVLPLYAPKNGTLKRDHQIEGDHAAKKGHVNDNSAFLFEIKPQTNSKYKKNHTLKIGRNAEVPPQVYLLPLGC